ncbi:CDP-archaeol synthase [uncultured Winogradskyella sp.]|uniref:CDP-archaeol synthase n=1 Tax=uncultured Winogradskyella sp. TaxID=395353 RepID=UPI00260709AE|nr:CDP-archaeol synthase [uncultured Winogradskyella sp.]
MVVIKRNYFPYLKLPISKKAFGSNKTWRGFIFIPIANAIILLAIDLTSYLNIVNPLRLGLTLGIAYMFFELPNSFIKRRLRIKSGEQSQSNKILFSLIDKTDSAFGVNLIYYLMGFVNLKYAIVLFVCSSLTHVLMSKLLVRFKLKKSF